MAELRFFAGWSEREIAERVRALEDLPTSVDADARRAMRAGARRWHPERAESVIGAEPPGPPRERGPFERARAAVERFAFSDPRIVRAYFDRGRPLLGRRMLLEIRVLGLRYLCGTVVGAVRDERGEDASTFGFRYDTLEGHLERGSEWFLVTKDHASGAIRFTIRSRWRPGDFPNLWSRAGFAVLSGPYRARWIHRAHVRMRAIAKGREPWPRSP